MALTRAIFNEFEPIYSLLAELNSILISLSSLVRLSALFNISVILVILNVLCSPINTLQSKAQPTWPWCFFLLGVLSMESWKRLPLVSGVCKTSLACPDDLLFMFFFAYPFGIVDSVEQ